METEEKIDDLAETRQLIEIWLSRGLSKKLQEIVVAGGYDSEQQVITRAIQNLYERTKFNQDGHLVVKEQEYLKTGFITLSKNEINKAITFLDKNPTSNELDYSERTKFYGNYNIGLINSFYNRLLPVKYALLVLLKLHLESQESWISFDDFKSKIKDASKYFVYKTNAIIKNDEILKDINLGFPKINVNQLNKIILTEKQIIELDKSMNHFIRKCVGAYVKNRDKNKNSHTMKGACFELGLMNVKMEYKNNEDDKKSKPIIYVSISDNGKNFVKKENPFLDKISKGIKPGLIFSKDEARFYLDKILPRFKFENEFVNLLIKKQKINHTNDVKDLFQNEYSKWLEKNHPTVRKEIHEKLHEGEDMTRINSLVIMARLIELGIFKKDPNSRFGPYELTVEWKPKEKDLPKK
tara:strand:+ start:757 stop:1986 length:1230 start_codon:yes stop_codon:yes gene_type:complete